MNDTATEPGIVPPTARLGSNYWRLWTASTISNLGDGMFLVALPLLAARTSDSSVEIALVTAFGMLPWLLVALHGGAIVDRSDKRKVLIATDTALAGRRGIPSTRASEPVYGTLIGIASSLVAAAIVLAAALAR